LAQLAEAAVNDVERNIYLTTAQEHKKAAAR
jgi:hypothetical protein